MAMKILLADLFDWPVPSMSLACLVGALEGTAHQARVVHRYPGRSLDFVLDEVERYDPDVVGFSVLSLQLRQVHGMCRRLKARRPDRFLLLGGKQPWLRPEETIADDSVDAICIGEGERTVVELLDRLAVGEPPHVPGVWYRRGREVTRCALRPFEQDLDALPWPDWDGFDLDAYLAEGFLYVMGSRGCPYSCSFCSAEQLRSKVPGRYYRCRSAESIVGEIRRDRDRYRSRGLRGISFLDDTFGLDPARFEAFVRQYRDANLHRELPWTCQTRADVVTREWARNARAAGCILVNLGLESADERVRMQTLNKQISNERFDEAIAALRDNGIFYSLFIMLGTPGESALDVIGNIRRARAMRPLFLQATPYTPIPGTALRAQHGEEIVVETRLMSGFPRISTDRLSVTGLWLLFKLFKLENVLRKLHFGFSLFGPSFGLDLLRYLLDLYRQSRLTLHHPSPPKSILNMKILNYLLSRWQRDAERVDPL
jgi:anaerobic magnesium-protoporphyrin IX monomethyl ester cyclase